MLNILRFPNISLLTIWLNCKLRTTFLKSIHSAIQLRVSLAVPLNLKVCYKCRKGCIVGATCSLQFSVNRSPLKIS